MQSMPNMKKNSNQVLGNQNFLLVYGGNMNKKDYYDVLGVDKSASDEEIKSAFNIY